MITNKLPTALNVDFLLKVANEQFTIDSILDELNPPMHFDTSEFVNYFPEPEYPSQLQAVQTAKGFISSLETEHLPLSRFHTWFRTTKKATGKGLYFDGGFGVGKTHILASSFHAFHGPKAYLSFQELMFLVGLESLDDLAKIFKKLQLLVIDEFELDDPANTRISTNLLGQLFDAGVSILTSSNTPPGSLGEGKFSTSDFKREMGVLFRRFKIVRIDGEDYRVAHFPHENHPSLWMKDETELIELLDSLPPAKGKILEAFFDEFLQGLAQVHPMRIRRAIGAFETIVWREVKQITHPHEALRFVYFVDKAYDNNIKLLVTSIVPIDQIFHHSYFTGGDTKKYLRTISRLREMTQSLGQV
ncbi:MAG: cell division protein ZapE [Bacteroidota bacterium]|nr:cell division protein ZapE [Bacteroidota bacterium]